MANPGSDRYLEVLTNNLRILVSGSGLTQAEIAKRTGLTPSYVNHLLQGKNRNPHIDNLTKLCEVLNTKLPALFIDPDFPPPITPQQAWVVIRAFLDSFFFMQPKPGGHSNNTYQARAAKKDEP